MTAAQAAPARQTTCRGGRPAPPCDPSTLGATCIGGCGRRLHPARTGGYRGPCADGHPRNNGHGLCTGCTSRARRRTHPAPTPMPRTVAVPADAGQWKTRAACRTADPDLFFPTISAGASFQKATERTARRYCRDCPVRRQCDEEAERTRSLGLWAGVWRRYRGAAYIATPVIPGAGREAS